MAAAAHSQSLSSARVRRVIGGHGVDGAVGQARPQRLDVGVGPQRRIDLVDRVVGRHLRLGEQQVMGRHLRGHVPALRLRPANQLHRAGRGHVTDVQPRTHVGREQHVPGDDRLLRDRRPPRQPEDAGELALVHLGALGQARLLCVLGHHPVERLDVLQRTAHQNRVRDALSVVGEDAHPGGTVGHRAELGQALAARARPSPRRPGRTSQCPYSLPNRQTCSTTPAVSATGSVFAIACTAVNPPRAAACVPDSTVSASSRPGSRRWVCRSTSPGSRTSPSASMTCAPAAEAPTPQFGDPPVGDQQIGGFPAEQAGPLDQERVTLSPPRCWCRSGCRWPPCCRTTAGTARPCVR